MASRAEARAAARAELRAKAAAARDAAAARAADKAAAEVEEKLALVGRRVQVDPEFAHLTLCLLSALETKS